MSLLRRLQRRRLRARTSAGCHPGTAGPQPLWAVASIEAAHARLLELGARPLDPIADVGGGIRVASVIDPFGNRPGLIENPNFDHPALR